MVYTQDLNKVSAEQLFDIADNWHPCKECFELLDQIEYGLQGRVMTARFQRTPPITKNWGDEYSKIGSIFRGVGTRGVY